MCVAAAVGVVGMSGGVAGASGSSLVIHTSGGDVQGVLVGAQAEWRGVPYAAPPVGDLRWRPPAPVVPWAGVRDATRFAPPCIQMASDTQTIGSENCLHLNVFAPATATPSSHLAVMVHLHPGGNAYGGPYQNAHAFTARGVIVVTVAYRLGVFGFMGHPALTAEGGGQSGEYGGLDQLAALQWVHDNIAAFGGDPSRVTLFGSSAGSFDTVAVMASPLSRGLISGAAVQGVSFWPLTGKNTTVADAEDFGDYVSSQVGCNTAADVLACLRAQPASTLVLAAGNLDIGGPPVGTTMLPAPPLDLLQHEPSVPLLVGFDREEDSTFYYYSHDPAGFPAPYTTKQFSHDVLNTVGGQASGKARSLYPASGYDSRLWAYITMRTDAVRGCPTRRLANTVVQHAPVWRYLDTHVYENDPGFAQFRAAHVFEDPFLWQFPVFGPGYVLTPAEQILARHMTDYWTNFAKSGDPNGPGLPTWPAYNTASEPTLVLDDQISQIANYHDAQCAVLDTIPEPFPAPWEQGQGKGPGIVPPGFFYGHAHAFP
jgi:para-nitrobenzyl esterase